MDKQCANCGTLLCGATAGWMRGALWLWAIVYLAWSTRAVYGGSWPGIAARAAVLVTAYSILFSFVTLGLLTAAILLR